MFCSIEDMVDDIMPSQKKFKSDTDDCDNPFSPVLSPAVIELPEEVKEEGPLPDPFPFQKTFLQKLNWHYRYRKDQENYQCFFLSNSFCHVFL